MEITKEIISLISSIIVLISALIGISSHIKRKSVKENKNSADANNIKDSSSLGLAFLILLANFILSVYYANWGMARFQTFVMCFSVSYAVVIIFNRFKQ